MEKAKISAIQLFALMFMFNMGTAVVVSYGIQAHKDAWIAILLGVFCGVILFFIYYRLYCQYSDLPITGYARKILGKYVGSVIGCLYIVYFFYACARNVRDFGDLLISSTLQVTPITVVNMLLVLFMCYVVHFGVEVLGRTAEVFIVVLFLFGIAGNASILVSGNINVSQLLPTFEQGWSPIIHTFLLTTSFFPFGEMIVFAMLLPYLNRAGSVKNVWLFSIISSGLILCWTSSLNIAVLGVETAERATFPTLATVSTVNIFDFIQRLDAIVVFTMLITVFFKAGVFLYGAVIGIMDLFQLKNYQQILLPSGVIIVYLSVEMASSFTEHLEKGEDIFRYFVHIPLFFVIPLFLLLAAKIRTGFKGRRNAKSKG
jgi:spore germination protein KB